MQLLSNRGTATAVSSVILVIGNVLSGLACTAALAQEGGVQEHGEESAKEGFIAFTAQELQEFGVTVGSADTGRLKFEVTLPGEVRFNEDRLAHVVPRLSGFVTEVHKTLGAVVQKGEVMAVLDSRELASAKAEYLASREREILAIALLEREEDLRKKKLSAERDYLAAKQAKAETSIEVRVAENGLHALGFSKKYVLQLSSQNHASLTRYEIVAPFDGTIVDKHIVLGEVVGSESEVFIISDLSSVWVDLSVYQKDLPSIEMGQEVVISLGHGVATTVGRISYVGTTVGENTRTALARIVVENDSGIWRPGSFVMARVATDEFEVPVRVPRAAIQMLEGQASVFVESRQGFTARSIVVGRTDAMFAEITSGLEAGERIAVTGTLLLKAELGKAAFGDDD